MVVILVVCFFVPPPYSIDCRSQCRFVCVSYRLSSLFSSLYIQSLYLMSFSLSLIVIHPLSLVVHLSVNPVPLAMNSTPPMRSSNSSSCMMCCLLLGVECYWLFYMKKGVTVQTESVSIVFVSFVREVS